MVGVLAVFAGCNLGTSIFPDRLMGYEAFADIAGYIDPDRVWNYNFQIIRNSATGTEYLVLANGHRSPDGAQVVIFNADLKVLGKFTLEQLDAMGAPPFDGRGAMVDANGDIVVGNRRFTVTARKATYASTPPTLWHFGIAIPEAPKPNFGNIRAENSSPVNFVYDTYLADWTSLASTTIPIGPGGWGKLFGVWLLEAHVMLISHRDGTPPQIFLLIRDPFAPCDPLTCNIWSFVPAPDKISWDTLGYTEEGFAVYRGDTNEYFRFDESGAIMGTAFSPSEDEQPHDQRHLYGRTAGWYILDRKEMTLERRPWWWLP